MKRSFLQKKMPLLLVCSALVLTVAFAQTGNGRSQAAGADTVPTKHKKIRDLDEALMDIDRGEAEVQRAMREIDGEKLERQIREAMKQADVDMAKAKEEMARALKEFDAQKINAEMQKALARSNRELSRENAEKIREEMKAAMANVNTEKLRAGLENMREVDMSKVRKELARLRPEMEKSIREAQKSIEKARAEISSYKELVNALDKDGYLDKDTNYKVEYRNGVLTVNGKRLPEETVKKYSEYLSGKKDFTLQKEDDGFDILNK